MGDVFKKLFQVFRDGRDVQQARWDVQHVRWDVPVKVLHCAVAPWKSYFHQRPHPQ